MTATTSARCPVCHRSAPLADGQFKPHTAGSQQCSGTGQAPEADKGTWYTFVVWGSGPAPARGPHPSEEAALEALRRFNRRHGADAGTYAAAGSVRLAGPFKTRREAKEADVSTHSGRPV